ncbi:MAG: glycerol-3-phosphate 1-O-acyltransferase PlsY [Endomicrobium sp.]|jgi:glycerol-3-phosphate acyltransferase PlsY|nr:glycerol-3-phosphate 1-O-acyltransferase PlsY [Endomicrobium sp.]
MVNKIIYIILSYLLGAIPFAYIITKLIKNVDIRNVNSGNVGTTNVIRTSGIYSGILTLILDVSKGVIAIYFARFINSSLIFISLVTIFVILGHMYSIFINFNGGKGVATTLGVFIVLTFIPTVVSVLIFIIIFIIFRYVSLASIIASISLPIILWLMNYNIKLVLLAILVCVFIILKHKDNIKRLFKNSEYKF